MENSKVALGLFDLERNDLFKEEYCVYNYFTSKLPELNTYSSYLEVY